MLRKKSKTTKETDAVVRTRWKWVTQKDGYGSSITRPARDEEQGDLFGSLTVNGLHAPCIDLDFDCELLPSSTPGHYHLMINKETSWENYTKLLQALYICGYIERGWFQQSMTDGQSFVRQPGVYKEYEELVKKIKETGDLFS